VAGVWVTPVSARARTLNVEFTGDNRKIGHIGHIGHPASVHFVTQQAEKRRKTGIRRTEEIGHIGHLVHGSGQPYLPTPGMRRRPDSVLRGGSK
jgi:hypothetical protein